MRASSFFDVYCRSTQFRETKELVLKSQVLVTAKLNRVSFLVNETLIRPGIPGSCRGYCRGIGQFLATVKHERV